MKRLLVNKQHLSTVLFLAFLSFLSYDCSDKKSGSDIDTKECAVGKWEVDMFNSNDTKYQLKNGL